MAREIAREPTGEAGALEEAQRARRGSGSPGLGSGQGSDQGSDQGWRRVGLSFVRVGQQPLPLPLTSRGSGSPVGERAGSPAAIRASARKSAGRAHAPSQKGETAAGPLITCSGFGIGIGIGIGFGFGFGSGSHRREGENKGEG